MRIAPISGFCAIFLSACLHAPKQTVSLNDEFPLACTGCSFVENRGTRFVSGKIQNKSKKSIDDISLVLELKDSKGNVVADISVIALPGVKSIQPRSVKEFSAIVANQRSTVTQVVVYFERTATKERLSVRLPLMLAVSLDSEDED